MIQPQRLSVTLMSGPRDGETLHFDTHRLDEQLTLSFGRRETCDVCLIYDSQVSRIHAQLTYDAGKFWLEDLNSRNGTYIDKQRIAEKVILKPGTLFRIGRTWLRLESTSEETLTADPFSSDDIPF